MSMHINDYVFEALLGRGTFGSVYIVRRKRDSKPFVVKEQVLNNTINALPFKVSNDYGYQLYRVLRITILLIVSWILEFYGVFCVINTISLWCLRVEEDGGMNILEEIECLHTLRHPNIVAYYGAWMENNHSYILMEFATRCTLKDLLEKRQEPLKEDDALYLFSQVVLGVRHIHFKKILHRDLKPENIMLTGNYGNIVKIGDFGVSKNFQDSKDPSITCRAGSFYYMAPEMLNGQSYDFKCDVWSMGVILYEMVTKRLPFPGTTLAEIMERACNEQPRPLLKHTSEATVSLISKMLRKQPSFRPKTDQLVLCPYLMPLITLMHLNLGRVHCTAKQNNSNFGPKMFLKFLKPRERSK